MSMSTLTNTDHEELAAALEQSGDYKVLRRFQVRIDPITTPAPNERLGIFLDLETTGLDPAKDEIIEIAMVPFLYTVDGKLIAVGEPFQSYRDPGMSVPSEITALTGITDEMVQGQSIDLAQVEEHVGRAAIIIAHNAAFDRKFAERLSPAFATKAWGCSMSQIPWAAEGIRGSKLAYLAAAAGFFFAEHRAVTDCQAAIEILGRPLPLSGRTALSALLHEARQRTCRVWAEGASFDLKEILKARRYRWSSGEDGGRKCWYIDVPEGSLDAEMTFLHNEIYQREIDIPITYVDAYARFSTRARLPMR
jgi:DNA polymerase-3 subunit epsilon